LKTTIDLSDDGEVKKGSFSQSRFQPYTKFESRDIDILMYDKEADVKNRTGVTFIQQRISFHASRYIQVSPSSKTHFLPK